MNQAAWVKLGVLALPLIVLGQWQQGFNVAWLLWTVNTLVTWVLSSMKGLYVNNEDVKLRLSLGSIFGCIECIVLPYCSGVPVSPRNLIVTSVSIMAVLLVVRMSKLTRNKCEISRLMDRNPFNIGASLAKTNFRFLENVIKGKRENIFNIGGVTVRGKGTFLELMQQHLQNELVPDSSYFPKLLILFPEWISLDSPWTEQRKQLIFGSVGDVLQKEKDEGATHTLTPEKITYSFKASGGMDRRMQLEVLKSRKHPSSVDARYLAFAENRPLNTLYMMVAESCVKFNKQNFNLQFQIYKRELGKLLDADPGCKDHFLILHYREGPGSFTKEINNLLDSGPFI